MKCLTFSTEVQTEGLHRNTEIQPVMSLQQMVMMKWFEFWKKREAASNRVGDSRVLSREFEPWDLPSSNPVTIDFLGLNYEECTITIPTRNAEFLGWRFERMRQGDNWWLAGLTFENCHFIDCDLYATQFEQCTFINCTICNTRLANVGFDRCRFDHSWFENCLLVTCFRGTNEQHVRSLIRNGPAEVELSTPEGKSPDQEIFARSLAIEGKWYDEYGTIRALPPPDGAERSPGDEQQ